MRFNADQRIAFDILYQAITSSEKDMFFLDEFNDIEKIFLINLILIKIQLQRREFFGGCIICKTHLQFCYDSVAPSIRV